MKAITMITSRVIASMIGVRLFLMAFFLVFIAIDGIPTFDVVTNVVGMGGIAIGVIPLFLNRKKIWRPAMEGTRRTSCCFRGIQLTNVTETT